MHQHVGKAQSGSSQAQARIGMQDLRGEMARIWVQDLVELARAWVQDLSEMASHARCFWVLLGMAQSKHAAHNVKV